MADCDVSVDASDSRAVTYMLSDACAAVRAPLVTASALGFEGYVCACCGNGPHYRALMPDMPWRAATCSSSGVLGPVVATLGALEAQ